MKKYVGVLLLVFCSLAKASDSTHIKTVYLEDGTKGFITTCLSDQNKCYEFAGSICKAEGYRTISMQSAGSELVPIKNASGSIFNAPKWSLIFQCKTKNH
ncbi:MAG: hypothetical protein ACYDB9_09960 [Gammaproteobacteria bacterium]